MTFKAGQNDSRLKQSISVFLEVGYKILSQPYVELHRQA